MYYDICPNAEGFKLYANQTSDEHKDITKKATLREQSVLGILFYN